MPSRHVDDGLSDALRQVTESVDPVDVAALLDAIESPGRRRRRTRRRPHAARARSPASSRAAPAGRPAARRARQRGRAHASASTSRSRPSPNVSLSPRAANLAAFLDHAAQFTGLEGESDLPAFLAFLDASADAEQRPRRRRGVDGRHGEADDGAQGRRASSGTSSRSPALSREVFPSSRGRAPVDQRRRRCCRSRCVATPIDLPALSGYDREASRGVQGRVQGRLPRRGAPARPTSRSRARVGCCSRVATAGPAPGSAAVCAVAVPAELRELGPTPSTSTAGATTRVDDATNPCRRWRGADVAVAGDPDEKALRRRRRGGGAGARR